MQTSTEHMYILGHVSGYPWAWEWVKELEAMKVCGGGLWASPKRSPKSDSSDGGRIQEPFFWRSFLYVRER